MTLAIVRKALSAKLNHTFPRQFGSEQEFVVVRQKDLLSSNAEEMLSLLIP